MVRTAIERVIKESVDDLCSRDSKYASALYECLQKLKSGFFDKFWTDVVFQKFAMHDIEIYEAYCFMRIWIDLHEGRLLTGILRVPGTPHSNQNISGNNKILKNIAPPFKAIFEPKRAGDDGFLEWTEEIHLKKIIADPHDYDGRFLKRQWMPIKPQRIPLEVGTTSAQKTFACIYFPGGAGVLARWPFEFNEIVILYLEERWRGANIDSSDEALSVNQLRHSSEEQQLLFPDNHSSVRMQKKRGIRKK